MLATEILKIKNGWNQEIMKNIFNLIEKPAYHL